MTRLISLLPSIFIMLLACAFGVLLTGKVWARASLKARLSFGIAVGLVALSWIGFLWALLFGLKWLSIGLTAVMLGLGVFLLRGSVPLVDFRLTPFTLLRWSCWLGFFAWLFSRVVMIESDGLHTAPANNYGDLAFHFSVVTSFADGGNFPPRNPIFSGLNFTYPFLIDFLTAFLHRAGADWAAAFFLSNIFLILALVGLMELLTERLTQNIRAARLAPVLFFLSGGAGFIYAFRDWQQAKSSEVGWWEFLWQLPQSYTKNDPLHLQWGNALTTLIVPQRSLLFGLPVFAMIVLLWLAAVHSQKTELTTPAQAGKRFFFPLPLWGEHDAARRHLFVAGLLAGLMPLLHAHGFFSVMIVSVPMALLFFSWDWLAFFIPAGILSLPQALWLSATGTKSSLFKWHLGWAAEDASLVKFYALNFGLFLLALIVALIINKTGKRRFYGPFLICLIVPNVMLLAPWPWDNIKVLLYWFLVSCPFVAALIALLLRRISTAVFGVGVLILLTSSGALDVVRSLSPVENLRLFDTAQLIVAERIKQRIPPQAIMLCAPIHNSVLALSGRQMVMGYPGHLWSHGIVYGARDDEVKAILQGGVEARSLLKKYRVDYVVIGPVEYADFNADEGFFAANFPVVIEAEGYRVYQINLY